jgi:hypothetical protein
METPTAPQSNIPPTKTSPTRNYLVPITILVGFLAAVITYRIINIGNLEQSRGELAHYEEIAGGRDYSSLMEDKSILRRITAQSLHDNGRRPTPDEVEIMVTDLAQAGELASELDEQRARFSLFMDVIIYGLTGIIVVFLAVLLFKRRHRHLL